MVQSHDIANTKIGLTQKWVAPFPQKWIDPNILTAERVGFEPTVTSLPRSISSRVP